MEREQLLAAIQAWANDNPNVRAVVLTGSAARGVSRMDELSDLDVELYVRDPAELLTTSAWYGQFGQILAVEALPNPGWHPTRLIYYVGGKVDFVIASLAALRNAEYTRPFEVLLDKDELATDLTLTTPSTHQPPDVDTFDRCINWFFAAVLMCAKAVARDEPWMAKFRDWDAKIQLLQMIEWDHKSRYGWHYETWFNGKHFNDWADADVRQHLEACWAGFTTTDHISSLHTTIDLFERLCTRAAPAVNTQPPDFSHIRTEVNSIIGHT